MHAINLYEADTFLFVIMVVLVDFISVWILRNWNSRLNKTKYSKETAVVPYTESPLIKRYYITVISRKYIKISIRPK